MQIWLQIILAVVVVALGACLVPLILQLQRTARSVQALADSAREDLARMAEDVHETRVEVTKVVGLVEKSLEFPATAGVLATTFVRSLTSMLDRGPSLWIEALVTAAKFGIDFLRRPRKAAPSKEDSNE